MMDEVAVWLGSQLADWILVSQLGDGTKGKGKGKGGLHENSACVESGQDNFFVLAR